MEAVDNILLQNIDDESSLFVFPTDISASRWADRVLRLKKGGTIAMEKFIAWDTFKQNAIRSKVKEKKSIPSVLRKIFVSALVEENAELISNGNTGIFNSLIRKEYSYSRDSYVDWLTGLLPQLAIWYSHYIKKGDIHSIDLSLRNSLQDDELDLLNLAIHYSEFLNKNNLFEPAWEKPPFENKDNNCFLFFTDSLSDFAEYRKLLENSINVSIYNAEKDKKCDRDIFFYTNSRSEITEAALYLLSLNQNNVNWESICLSIPEKEYYAPYIYRELDNRNIPYIVQSGKALSSYPAGKFFNSLLDCVSSDFSFSSLSELLLNKHLPWKNITEIQNLINFGINNNCISSFEDIDNNGKTSKWINVWEDSFENPYGRLEAGTKTFFSRLKSRAGTLCRAESFAELRKQYFIFRDEFLDMDNALKETDIVLSRCIAELGYLTEIEKDFTSIKVKDPYSFFTSYLKDTNYLAQEEKSGVSILPYKTAAPVPFNYHIILGANQDTLTNMYSPLAFLPKNKRENMGIMDIDASNTFIALHQHNSVFKAAFFCSEERFSGHGIPHSSLDAGKLTKQNYREDAFFSGMFYPDLYKNESKFLSTLEISDLIYKNIHTNQKEGYYAWAKRKIISPKENNAFSVKDNISEIINKKFSREFTSNNSTLNKIGVSSTSLSSYFTCPLNWIFNRILELENTEVETTLMANSISGIVFHSILNLFFGEIKKENKAILAPLISGTEDKPVFALPEKYSDLLQENAEYVFSLFPMLPNEENQTMSMLTSRLIKAQKEQFIKYLDNFLISFTSYFSNYKIIETESSYIMERDDYFLRGIVDCVLEDPDNKNKLYIVDFKTSSNGMGKISDYTGEEGLKDFQLPMYIRLIEDKYKKEVHAALFFSIINPEPMVLFGKITHFFTKETRPIKEQDCIYHQSETYIKIMNEFDCKADKFALELRENNIPHYNLYNDVCPDCPYNKVCRSLYAINRGALNGY